MEEAAKVEESCLHWQELEQQAADRKFDAGEFSRSRQSEPANAMCGLCVTCRDYAAELEQREPELIHSYSRRHAIEDGVLVSFEAADNPELSRLCAEAGFKFPIAMTVEAFSACVALTPAAERAGCDIKGRLWDVLNMLGYAIRRAGPSQGQELLFELYVVRDRVRPTRTKLKCIVGPGDDAEPVFTIMFPEQS